MITEPKKLHFHSFSGLIQEDPVEKLEMIATELFNMIINIITQRIMKFFAKNNEHF